MNEETGENGGFRRRDATRGGLSGFHGLKSLATFGKSRRDAGVWGRGKRHVATGGGGRGRNGTTQRTIPTFGKQLRDCRLPDRPGASACLPETPAPQPENSSEYIRPNPTIENLNEVAKGKIGRLQMFSPCGGNRFNLRHDLATVL